MEWNPFAGLQALPSRPQQSSEVDGEHVGAPNTSGRWKGGQFVSGNRRWSWLLRCVLIYIYIHTYCMYIYMTLYIYNIYAWYIYMWYYNVYMIIYVTCIRTGSYMYVHAYILCIHVWLSSGRESQLVEREHQSDDGVSFFTWNDWKNMWWIAMIYQLWNDWNIIIDDHVPIWNLKNLNL